MKTKLKVEDKVIVIAGKSKGETGDVLFVDKKRKRIFLKGVNLKKRYVKTQENPKGQLLETEHPIHISNVMYYDVKTKKRSKLQYKKNEKGKKTRFLSKLNREI